MAILLPPAPVLTWSKYCYQFPATRLTRRSLFFSLCGCGFRSRLSTWHKLNTDSKHRKAEFLRTFLPENSTMSLIDFPPVFQHVVPKNFPTWGMDPMKIYETMWNLYHSWGRWSPINRYFGCQPRATFDTQPSICHSKTFISQAWLSNPTQAFHQWGYPKLAGWFTMENPSVNEWFGVPLF